MKKILIVEDDPMLSEIYNKKFTQDGFFEVLKAVSGGEAEEKIRKHRPDLVLLDLVLPEKDGFQILKEIREDSSLNSVKIIIFSNLSQEEEQQKAKTLGANGFIAKSDFTPQQIVVEVKKILGEEEIGDEKQSIIGSADKKEKSVSWNNKKIPEKKGKNVIDELGFSPKILVVEDEEVFLEVFGLKLKEYGFEVETASNGGWGLKLTEKNKYDAILLDILMPVLNGVDLIKKIKKNGKNKETPLIVLSGSIDEQGQRDEVLESGASDVLIKTHVTPSEVVECVKKHIKNNVK